MKIRVTSQFQVDGDNDLEARVDGLFRELLRTEAENPDVSQADVSMVLADRIVQVSVVIRTDSWESAETRAHDVIWQAIERSESARVDEGEDPLARIDDHVRSTELVPV